MSEAMKSHFLMMARYNAWANARVYRMASQLSDEQYRRDVGAYFKSLHGTLNHLLATDRIWMHRLTGEGDHPTRLDAIVFDDLSSLTAARREEDERIIRFLTIKLEKDGSEYAEKRKSKREVQVKESEE